MASRFALAVSKAIQRRARGFSVLVVLLAVRSAGEARVGDVEPRQEFQRDGSKEGANMAV